MSFLEVQKINIREERNFALQKISFTQQVQQRIAIAGETGSGKSTLLQIIAGLVQPDSGEVLLEGTKVIGPADTLVPGHPGIAYLSQQFELPPFLRVEQVLGYANTFSVADAETLYRLCQIDHLLARRTNQLSGGERQRIALAKLLLGAPKLLLLDEPFSNLDLAHKNLLKTVIRDIGEKLGITLMLISHDPQDTLSWADEILVMKEGQLLQKGTPEQIYRQPVNTYVAGLFGNYNLFPAAGAKTFAALAGIHLNNKDILIRPESLKLTEITNKPAGKTIPGKVKAAIYYGSHYELEVEMAGITVQVKTGTHIYHKGDVLDIWISPADIWYV